MESRRFELLAFAVRSQRATNCANSPRAFILALDIPDSSGWSRLLQSGKLLRNQPDHHSRQL